MSLLIAGVLFWSVVHLLPSAAPTVRSTLAAKLGEGLFKGLFALDIVIALVLIIYGWKTAVPSFVYAPPMFGGSIPTALLILAVLLMAASSMPNNLRRYIRHPQMTGVLCWSAGHLLSNGDNRSIVLFGGLGLWAILEMLFINKRDGEWQRPDSVAMSKDLLTALTAAAAFALLANLHTGLFGVSALPA